MSAAEREQRQAIDVISFGVIESGATGWHFATTCVDSTGPLINALIDSEKEISYRTFRRELGGAELDRWAAGMLYSVGAERGLHLKDDWHVGFYRGEFDGRPALFVRHSAIEHIWTLERD